MEIFFSLTALRRCFYSCLLLRAVFFFFLKGKEELVSWRKLNGFLQAVFLKRSFLFSVEQGKLIP